MRLLLSAILMLGATAAAGAPRNFPPLQRKPVLEAKLPPANPAVHLVRGVAIHFAPSQPTGVHYHPASTVGVITEGTILFQPDGEPERTLHVGDVFFEPAHKKIVHFDNASPTKPAAITVFYLTDTKERPLIEMLGK